VQLEIPLEAVGATAAAAGGTLVLDPAPARPLPQEILERVNVLTPNEVELAMLSGMSAGSHDDVVAAARSIEGPEAIAVTLGRQGVTLVTMDDVVRIPAHPVDVVDTTAAGDAFCGALADALARGEELVAATRWAVAAAAVAVTRMGAQPSLPRAEEVRALLQSS
jgi:ribokinase